MPYLGHNLHVQPGPPAPGKPGSSHSRHQPALRTGKATSPLLPLKRFLSPNPLPHYHHSAHKQTLAPGEPPTIQPLGSPQLPCTSQGAFSKSERGRRLFLCPSPCNQSQGLQLSLYIHPPEANQESERASQTRSVPLSSNQLITKNSVNNLSPETHNCTLTGAGVQQQPLKGTIPN